MDKTLFCKPYKNKKPHIIQKVPQTTSTKEAQEHKTLLINLWRFRESIIGEKWKNIHPCEDWNLDCTDHAEIGCSVKSMFFVRIKRT